jgi:hypothetical protein
MRYLPQCILFLAFFLCACAPVDSTKVFDEHQAAILLNEHLNTEPAAENIALYLPNSSNWQRIDLSLLGKGSPIMLIPRGQSKNDWQESIRTYIRAYINEPDMTAQEFMLHDWQYFKSRCQKVSTQILSTTENSVLYRNELKSCKIEPDQIRITKAFNGSDAVYAVYYAATPVILPTRIRLMESVIAQAELVKH